MLKLYDNEGRTVYVAAANICRVDTAGASSQWHGVRSFVRLFDGGFIECGQDADAVARLMMAEDPLHNAVAQILDAGHMNTEDLARLRAAFDQA